MYKEQCIRHIPVSCYSGFLRDVMAGFTPDQQELVRSWIAIGREDDVISRAVDPPFDEGGFGLDYQVDPETTKSAARSLTREGWNIGDARGLGDICFINRGGTEWLLLKGKNRLGTVRIPEWGETVNEARARVRHLIARVAKTGTL